LRPLAVGMAAARAEECRKVTEQAVSARTLAGPERQRTLRRLREELRRIQRRDYFPPPEADTARLAVDALATDRTDADLGEARR
jgi:hypothetical protein